MGDCSVGVTMKMVVVVKDHGKEVYSARDTSSRQIRVPTPTMLASLNSRGRKVVKYSAGQRHAMALLDDQSVYIWGACAFVHLATDPPLRDLFWPERLKLDPLLKQKPGNWLIKSVSAIRSSVDPFQLFCRRGFGILHLISPSLNAPDALILWGRNEAGQLGYPLDKGAKVDEEVKVPSAVAASLNTSEVKSSASPQQRLPSIFENLRSSREIEKKNSATPVSSPAKVSPSSSSVRSAPVPDDYDQRQRPGWLPRFRLVSSFNHPARFKKLECSDYVSVGLIADETTDIIWIWGKFDIVLQESASHRNAARAELPVSYVVANPIAVRSASTAGRTWIDCSIQDKEVFLLSDRNEIFAFCQLELSKNPEGIKLGRHDCHRVVQEDVQPWYYMYRVPRYGRSLRRDASDFSSIDRPRGFGLQSKPRLHLSVGGSCVTLCSYPESVRS